MAPEGSAPPVLYFDSLDSTNEEALRQLGRGCDTPLWIVAGEQSRGRGRSGRRWQSPKGNLYASLLLRLNVSAVVATELSFVAALAAYDAISSQLSSEQLAALALKWPNDVMLKGSKIAGILIESLADPKGSRLAAIIGIGVNVGAAPPDTGRPVAALNAPPADCARVFSALAAAFETWRSRWNEGKGFASVREAWLARAHKPGEPITVHLYGSAIRGTFRGVDARGALQLETSGGVVITLTAGDIYPDAQGLPATEPEN